jgi:rSAM/selenodomain-associated transferase 2
VKQLSIVVPVLNESHTVPIKLRALVGLREAGHEVIVVDGGSQDDTASVSKPLVDRVVVTDTGRGHQMNVGARHARGEVLLFLHADTMLPEGAPQMIRQALTETAFEWGYFRVRLSGHHPLLRLVEAMMNLRSRLTRIATGDQALFVRRESFASIGGFPRIPLMEDLVICKRLKTIGPPAQIKARVKTSSRRWEQRGLLRTIVEMWSLRLAFFFGASPEKLFRYYYGNRP